MPASGRIVASPLSATAAQAARASIRGRVSAIGPGSKNPTHIRDNLNLFDFSLTEDEMAQIAALNRNVRYYTSTPELLEKYAQMVLPVDEQK